MNEAPTICYGSEGESAAFQRVCDRCGRFVKADDEVRFKGALVVYPNATCSRCGRVDMPFLGWVP